MNTLYLIAREIVYYNLSAKNLRALGIRKCEVFFFHKYFLPCLKSVQVYLIFRKCVAGFFCFQIIAAFCLKCSHLLSSASQCVVMLTWTLSSGHCHHDDTDEYTHETYRVEICTK